MRKLLLALICLFCMGGVVLAADVTFIKFDGTKKELTVKEGEVEKTYSVNEKTKVLLIDMNDKATDADLKILEKAREGKTKLTISADKTTITEIRIKGRKSK